jgi:hypothetical protein
MKRLVNFPCLIFILFFVLYGCDSIGNEDNSGDGDTSYWFAKQGAPGTLTMTTPPPDANGSFTVTGIAKNNFCNYIYVVVSKDNSSGDLPPYYYYIRGNSSTGAFSQEIHLRYGNGGDGKYTVTFINTTAIEVSLQGEGFIYSIKGIYYPSLHKFQVTNTKTGDEDSWQLLSSGDIQVTDPEIVNLKKTILSNAGVSSGTDAAKMKAINKWVVLNLSYDNDSLEDSRRKKQDALSALHNRTAVCEGYANLTSALARAAGIRSRYIASESMNHGWMQVLVDGQWKMVDSTWNDPDDKNGNNPFTEANWNLYTQYTEAYLLLPDNTGVNNDHHGGAVDKSRSAAGGEYEYYSVSVEPFPGW